MDSVMIQDNNSWNLISYDEMMTVPPSSPQEASHLESIFSSGLSAKMRTPMSSSDTSSELHARKLNGLLLHCKKRSHIKRPSRIPVLSCRVIHKKKKQEDKKSMEKIVQELKDMGL